MITNAFTKIVPAEVINGQIEKALMAERNFVIKLLYNKTLLI